MKSILDTTLYNIYRVSNNLDLKQFLKMYNPEKDNVKFEMIEEQLNRITKRFNFQMKNQIMQSTLVDNTIVPIYNLNRIHLPIFIPALLVNPTRTKIIALVNITKQVTKEDKTNNILEIDAIKLYAMLQSGFLLLKCHEYEKSIEINQDLLFYGSSCYSAMLSKILDKLYAINLNMVRGDRVKFLCAMFFLLNVMDKKTINENLINLSMRSASSEFTQREALQLLESLDENAFADLASFINTLSKIEGLGSINLRVVINEYVKMYGRNTLFGLEYYPFFLFSIFSSVINSNLNNGYIIENLLGDQADKLFKAFSAVVQ